MKQDTKRYTYKHTHTHKTKKDLKKKSENKKHIYPKRELRVRIYEEYDQVRQPNGKMGKKTNRHFKTGYPSDQRHRGRYSSSFVTKAHLIN